MEQKKCFVIMPISEIEAYGENHFQKVFQNIIEPACAEVGYKAVRADKTKEANMILFGILNDLLSAEIAICDITTRNPNVFYELGIRHARNLKTVIIKDEKTDYPFDVSGIRHLDYNSTLSYDSVLEDRKNLVDAIKDTMSSAQPNSPLEIFEGYQKFKMISELEIIKKMAESYMLDASTGETQTHLKQ